MLVNPVSLNREAVTYYLFETENLTERITIVNGIKKLVQDDYLMEG